MRSKRSLGKILVAITHQDLDEIRDVLGSEFDTIICHDLKEVCLNLDETIAVILCGLRFDRGRIFDLLRHAKADPKTRSIPFFSVVERRNIFSPAILDSIEMASTVLGANGFINLFEASNTAGKADAYERVRQTLRQLI